MLHCKYFRPYHYRITTYSCLSEIDEIFVCRLSGSNYSRFGRISSETVMCCTGSRELRCVLCVIDSPVKVNSGTSHIEAALWWGDMAFGNFWNFLDGLGLPRDAVSSPRAPGPVVRRLHAHAVRGLLTRLKPQMSPGAAWRLIKTQSPAAQD